MVKNVVLLSCLEVLRVGLVVCFFLSAAPLASLFYQEAIPLFSQIPCFSIVCLLPGRLDCQCLKALKEKAGGWSTSTSETSLPPPPSTAASLGCAELHTGSGEQV
jgi:hypothetical protein